MTKQQTTIPEQVNDNQPETEQKPSEDLDFSADKVSWDSSTDHLDEIVEEQDQLEYDDISGLKKTEIFTKDRFFTDFFCQNMELAECMTGMVGLSVDVSGGKAEKGARETSDILYEQCQKFRFLHWVIKTDISWIKNVVLVMIFVKVKADIVAMNIAARKEIIKEPPVVANDNNEPLDDTA